MSNQYIGKQHQPKGASVVYWIHTPQHTDMFNEGYIGITNQRVTDRWSDHKRHAKQYDHLPIYRAIRKSELIFEVIVVGQTREYCQQIEAALRPTERIGYNLQRGGDVVDTKAGGLANKARLDLLKITNSYWIAKEAAKQANKERKRLYKEAAAKKKKDKEEYKANGTGQLNRKLDKRNTSGYMGVSLHPCGRYRAQYRGKGLGYFKTADEAYNAYVLAKQNYLLSN